MGKHQVKARGRHRAQPTARARHRSARALSLERRSIAVKATISAVGAAGVAVGGAAVIGTAPTLSASTQLMAALHYLRGTNIGGATEQQYLDFIDRVLDGTDTTAPEQPYQKVPYNAGFRPFSHGGFSDLTYNDSVQEGVDLLEGQHPAQGDTSRTVHSAEHWRAPPLTAPHDAVRTRK
jgi:hypothetical protein